MKFYQKNKKWKSVVKTRSNSEGCIRMASEDDKVSNVLIFHFRYRSTVVTLPTDAIIDKSVILYF